VGRAAFVYSTYPDTVEVGVGALRTLLDVVVLDTELLDSVLEGVIDAIGGATATRAPDVTVKLAAE
jgi:hypothetical protein